MVFQRYILSVGAQLACRRGHEAFLEAFANVYADFADLVAARRTGRAPDPLASVTPDAIVGAEGLAFVDACIELTKTRTWAKVRRVT